MFDGYTSPEIKVVLITGASSGFGLEAAKLIAQRGYRVFGTSRNADKHRPTALRHGFEMLALDVRDDASVQACVDTVMERAGRIDVLINNAGYELAGAIEETSIEEAQAQLDTNFFGVARMTNAVLSQMRERRSGHIINIGSMAGLLASPFAAFYTASKFALEGYTEALRIEMLPFNVMVSIVEPGFYKTEIARVNLTTAKKIADYDERRRMFASYIEENVNNGADPKLVAWLLLDILEDPYPKQRYPISLEAKWLPRIRRLSPPKWYDFTAPLFIRVQLWWLRVSSSR